MDLQEVRPPLSPPLPSPPLPSSEDRSPGSAEMRLDGVDAGHRMLALLKRLAKEPWRPNHTTLGLPLLWQQQDLSARPG